MKDLKVMAWFLRPYAGTVALIFFLLFSFTVLEAASIGAFYPLIAGVLPGSDAQAGGRLLGLLSSLASYMPGEGVVASAWLLAVLAVSAAALGFFAESFAMWHRYKLLEDFFNAVYRKITSSKYLYFLEKRQGELIYLGVDASQSVGEMLMYFPKVGVELFRLASIVVLLLTISVKVTLSIIGLLALFAGVVQLLSVKLIHPVAVRLQKANAGVTAIFTESMAGIKQIKIFDSHPFWRELFAAKVREARSENTRNAVYGFIPGRLIMVVGTLSVAGAIVTVQKTAPDRLGAVLPIIAIYVLALQRMMPSINNIGSYWMGLKGLAPRLELTYKALTDETYDQPEAGDRFPGLAKGVTIDAVAFSYPSRAGVLKGVAVEVPKGATVAVVGESGSGKSTLADLLARLYEPQSGAVRVDGRDVREFSLSSYLARVGMVTQDTFVFHASIRDNIRMGKPDATDAEVRRAAELAHAHDFISELPEGYDTVVGDRGVKLSGGQRQRVAIARAVLRDPELLILDEATSALDNVSEKIVQEALASAGKGRTTVVIAHRLSTVEHADKIVVMSRGEVVEQGSHAELLGRKGAYFALYQKQRKETVA